MKVLDCLDRFSKNIQISNFMKICPLVNELFHADEWTDGRTDGETDVTELTGTVYRTCLKYSSNENTKGIRKLLGQL